MLTLKQAKNMSTDELLDVMNEDAFIDIVKANTLDYVIELEKIRRGCIDLLSNIDTIKAAALWRFHAATKRGEKPFQALTIQLGDKVQDFYFPTFEDVCEQFQIEDFSIHQGERGLPTFEEQAAKVKSWNIPFDEQKFKEKTFEYFCISHVDLTPLIEHGSPPILFIH